MAWRSIDIPISELCIDTTLRCGQSFRWKQSGPQEYSCAIHGRLITLRQDATKLYYKAIFPPIFTNDSNVKTENEVHADVSQLTTDSDQEKFELQETQRFLRHYLNLEPNLNELYTQWSEKDRNFARRAPKFHGVRILKQDAWEALVGFVCSSCNNIKRISQMMDKLCANYGPLIGHIDDVPYYDMPSPAALVNPRVEAHLRELGFGYRAAYLFQTAQMVAREADGWLDSLRNPESPVFGHRALPAGPMQPEGREGYRKAHAALVELQGVGAKVADCVCLFGLGWGEAVPVDTHVWQIAQRDYGFGRGKHKSLTKATYDTVANYFRQLWGKEAGWAHSVLFTADLKTFAEKAAADIVESDFLGPVKAEEDVKHIIMENTFNGEPHLSSPTAYASTVSIKQEDAIFNHNDATDTELDELPRDQRIVSPKYESEQELEASENVTEFIKNEGENTVLPGVKAEIVVPIKTSKRKASRSIKKEEINAATQLATPTIKRRRSARLHG